MSDWGLAALKKEDLFDRSIDVHRTETHYQNENGENVYEVQDFMRHHLLFCNTNTCY